MLLFFVVFNTFMVCTVSLEMASVDTSLNLVLVQFLQRKKLSEWTEIALTKRGRETRGRGQVEATADYQNTLLIRSEYFHQATTCGRCNWERTAGCWFLFPLLREAS